MLVVLAKLIGWARCRRSVSSPVTGTDSALKAHTEDIVGCAGVSDSAVAGQRDGRRHGRRQWRLRDCSSSRWLMKFLSLCRGRSSMQDQFCTNSNEIQVPLFKASHLSHVKDLLPCCPLTIDGGNG